jgi:amino acid transporter
LVTIMLFFYRKVYCEVVSAIPVNGGTYNLMLNTTNKKIAAFVACLSILSYLATAIISAFDAVIYLSLLWEGVGMYVVNLISC